MATWREVQKWLETLPHRGKRPIYYDGDYYCSICGEPWNARSLVDDMGEKWAEKFMKGLGCPDCKGIVRKEEGNVRGIFLKRIAEGIRALRLLGPRRV